MLDYFLPFVVNFAGVLIGPRELHGLEVVADRGINAAIASSVHVLIVFYYGRKYK
jgi:hypothetical protein